MDAASKALSTRFASLQREEKTSSFRRDLSEFWQFELLLGWISAHIPSLFFKCPQRVLSHAHYTLFENGFVERDKGSAGKRIIERRREGREREREREKENKEGRTVR